MNLSTVIDVAERTGPPSPRTVPMVMCPIRATAICTRSTLREPVARQGDRNRRLQARAMRSTFRTGSRCAVSADSPRRPRTNTRY